jgi:tetratricopeptide (TPR) repeat protein
MTDDLRAIETDEELAEAELGYAECDWSQVDPESIAEHDRVIEMSPEDLEKLNIDGLDDLAKWAAAQAFADFEDDDRFHDVALRIVRSEAAHPAVDYTGICLELWNDYALLEQWDDAVFLLPDVERLVPDDESIRARFGAVISIGRGRTEEGMEVFQTLIDANAGDAEALLQFAHDLAFADVMDFAIEVLDKADEVAAFDNDQEMIAAVTEMREYISSEE